MSLTYTVAMIQADVSEYLANRVVVPAQANEWIRKAVLELSRDYEFPSLQHLGPTVSLIVDQPNYAYNYFMQPGDAGLDISKVLSFFMFYTYPYVPLATNVTSAPGVNLKFSTMGDLEQMINISSLPVRFGRFNNQIWVAFAPDQPYSCYMRYQFEHPFPNAMTAEAGVDPILLEDEWMDIVGYAAALRGAISLRLLDIAADFRTILYGDPKFQMTGGTEGQPGLIFRRVSQRERDTERAVKSMRLVQNRGR